MTAEIPADHLDLVTAPGVVALTTIGPSGFPQSSAIWFLYEDGVVRTSLTAARQKLKNLLANPKASLFWIDPANPMRTLELRGEAVVEDDADLAFLHRLFAHYGADPVAYGVPLEDRVVVSFPATRVRVNG